MKLLETCRFNPKKYITNSNEFICEHPVLFYEEEHSNEYGQIYECPICGRKFNSLKREVTESSLNNRYLLKMHGMSTKHYYHGVLIIIRKIAFNYMNYSQINLPRILKAIDPEIKEYLQRINPNLQYKNIIESKVKKITRNIVE